MSFPDGTPAASPDAIGDGPERLLVFGDDGSPNADVAWLWVCNHRWAGWRAEVLTATDPLAPPVRVGTEARLEPWPSPYGRTCLAEGGLSAVDTLTTAQDPRLMLESRGDADLLVVAPHSHRRSGPVLGSTTEWLLHHPPAPMAIVRSATPTRRVVACVDGSGHSLAAVTAFTRLPWAGQASVTVLWVDDGRNGSKEHIDDAVEHVRAAGVEPVVVTVSGKPTPQILAYVDEHAPQLVVLGTRGLTGWKRLRVGSTAGAVVRSVHCTTLVACLDEPEGHA